MRELLTSKLKLSVAALVLAIGAFFAINGVMSTVEAAYDTPICDNNSVIKCGVTSVQDLRNKYASDYTKGTQNIFSHFGINSNVLNNYTVKEGVVYKNGDVKVGNKLVATGAHSSGRQLLPNSTKHVVNGTTFYTRPLSSSGPASWKVYVFFDKNDRFYAAVMTACGNPVKAKPVEPPKKPEPAYACASLSRIQKDRDTYTFRAKASVKNGAVLNGFTFTLGDGTSKYVAHAKHASDTSQYKYVDLEHSYAKAGTYNVKVTAHFKVNSKTVTKTSDNCQKSVTIEDKERPPVKPPVKKVAECVELEAQRIGAKSFELTATANVSNGATISSYYFVIRNVPTDNPSTDPIYFQERINSSATNVSTETGELTALHDGATYQATVAVTTSEGVKTGPACVVKIHTDEKDEPEKVKVCDLSDKSITWVTEEQLEDNPDRYTTDLERCKEDEQPPVKEDKVKVCDPETGDIIKVPETDRHKYLDVDSAECKDKPVVKGAVKELPQTGLAEELSGVLGLGALTTAVYYYAISRRNG